MQTLTLGSILQFCDLPCKILVFQISMWMTPIHRSRAAPTCSACERSWERHNRNTSGNSSPLAYSKKLSASCLDFSHCPVSKPLLDRNGVASCGQTVSAFYNIWHSFQRSKMHVTEGIFSWGVSLLSSLAFRLTDMHAMCCGNATNFTKVFFWNLIPC